MASSKAATPDEYLSELPAERREVVSAVRRTILRHLPKGYEERMNWGMISYEIPLERYPETYNGQPLMYAALAAQKKHIALYLMGPYQDPVQAARLEQGFERIGRKMDMGKSCLRFRQLEDLPLDDLGEVIASTPPEELIRSYEASRRK